MNTFPTDLTGQKIDMLYIEKMITKTPWDKKSYLCKCDCGNTCIRLHSTLIDSKNTHCCGCISKKYLIPGDSVRCSKAGKNRKKVHFNGCNIQMTFRKGTIISNTSGIQGISWSKSANKWHVYIGYQNYRANLGFFKDINIATNIRKEAENAIRNNTFEDFFFNLRGYHLGEKNSKQFKKIN